MKTLSIYVYFWFQPIDFTVMAACLTVWRHCGSGERTTWGYRPNNPCRPRYPLRGRSQVSNHWPPYARLYRTRQTCLRRVRARQHGFLETNLSTALPSTPRVCNPADLSSPKSKPRWCAVCLFSTRKTTIWHTHILCHSGVDQTLSHLLQLTWYWSGTTADARSCKACQTARNSRNGPTRWRDWMTGIPLTSNGKHPQTPAQVCGPPATFR